jgi:hypothetical protein
MQDAISTPVMAKGTTGKVCEESGPYISADEPNPDVKTPDQTPKVIVFFKKGQPFPVNSDGTLTTWTMVREGKEVVEGKVQAASR